MTKEKPLPLNELSLYGAFKQSADKYPDAPCILYFWREFSYKHVLAQIDRTAELLVAHGIKKGDIITTLLPNIPQTEFLIYGANKIGAVVHLLHPMHSIELLTKNLNMTESKFVFAMDTIAGKYLPLVESGRITLFSVSPAGQLPKFKQFFYKRKNKIKIIPPMIDFDHELKCMPAGAPTEEVTRDLHATSFLFNGSGTNGKVNTIEFSDFAVNSIMHSYFEIDKLTLDVLDVNSVVGCYMCAALPIFHLYGFTLCMHFMNCVSGCNTLIPKYSSSIVIKYLSKAKINYFAGNPQMIRGLLNNKEFASGKIGIIRTAWVAADIVPHKLIDDYNELMMKIGGNNILQAYGPSESGAMVCTNSHVNNRCYSCGIPASCAKFRIYDEKTKKLKTTGVGELYVGGDCIFNGYYKSPEMNKECIYVDKKGERYLKAGDIMQIDPDGYVTFVSRIKRIIKVSGFSIFPSEIEQIAMSVAGVRSACAIGVPDNKTGQRVVLYFEAPADNANLRGCLQTEFEKMLLPKSRPTEIIYIDKIPLTPYSKIDANKLLELYTNN